jgi:hypothetical protein
VTASRPKSPEAEQLLICLFSAPRNEVNVPQDWAALIRHACRYGYEWYVWPSDFAKWHNMTVEELALAVLAERWQREVVNP